MRVEKKNNTTIILSKNHYFHHEKFNDQSPLFQHQLNTSNYKIDSCSNLLARLHISKTTRDYESFITNEK